MERNRKTLLIYLISIFLVNSLKYCGATLDPYPTDWKLNDFERMKSDLFSKSENEEFRHQNLSPNDKACSMELNAIRDGLNRNLKDENLWAIELVDAWGKLPSAFLDGNLYDFGGFRECFHIERNEQHYQTKYCLGQMKLDMKQPLLRKYTIRQYNGIYPDYFKALDDNQTAQRSGSAFTFGLCVPAACSMDYLQSLLETNGIKNNTPSIRFLEHTCQFEENITDFKIKDWLAIGFFVSVLILMLLSTVYDIVYTASDSLGKKSQLLSAFSVYSNAKSLLSYELVKSPNVIHCMHGLRALGAQWVVYGHIFHVLNKIPLRNKADISIFMNENKSIFIHTLELTVEIFFVISGVLTAISLLKHFEKTKGKINILSLYFHRYLRLTPLFAVTMLYSATLSRFFGDGPIWSNSYAVGNSCEKNWWQNLLYIQNYFGPDGMCLLHTWYLAVDMQLFIISPFVIYLIYHFKKKAIIGLIFVILGSIGWRLITYDQLFQNAVSNSSFEFNMIKLKDLSFPTHLRCSTWLIGVIAGYFIGESKKRIIHIPKWLDVLTWVLSVAALVAALIFKWQIWNLNSWTFGLSDTLPHTVWCVALSCLIFASVHNAGGPFVWFLSHPLWQPLSRLSYATYLIHLTIITTILPSIKAPIYFSELDFMMTFIAISVITTIISIIVSLAFESPIANIEQLLFSPKKIK